MKVEIFDEAIERTTDLVALFRDDLKDFEIEGNELIGARETVFIGDSGTDGKSVFRIEGKRE